jgi:hypothetical protein
MRKLILIATFILFPTVSLANSNICKLEENSFSAQAIAWDSFNGKAKVTDTFNETHLGQVTLQREHAPWGVKTNIFVKYDSPKYGEDAAEYVIFPTGENEYRVIAVTYVLSDGRYHLSTSKGNYTATCISL